MKYVHGDSMDLRDLRSVDLNLLVTFEAVVTARSVSRAAEQLGITQPAVSHALRRLRRIFRDELLVRGPDGMQPTPRASEIASVLAGSLSDIAQVLDQERDFDPRSSTRSFTLHVSDYVAPFLLPDLCSRLRAAAPTVQLNVAHFQQPADRVQPNEIHIRVATKDETPGVATEDERLLEDSYVVLMSRDHVHAQSPLTLEVYLDLAHVKVSATALGTNVIDDALARRGLERRIAVTAPSWFEMRRVIAQTDLVVAMPRRWASDPRFSEGCVWQPLPVEEVTLAVDMRWRRRDEADPANRWLRRLVSTTVGSGP